MKRLVTPENVITLNDNEIFVFGSNYGGHHGKGAALTALRKFGAINGQGAGPMGKSYGIPTKDRFLKTLTLERIQLQVDRFIRYANKHKEQIFLVTAIGCGLSKCKVVDIAVMFKNAPENVALPQRFIDVLEA